MDDQEKGEPGYPLPARAMAPGGDELGREHRWKLSSACGSVGSSLELAVGAPFSMHDYTYRLNLTAGTGDGQP